MLALLILARASGKGIFKITKVGKSHFGTNLTFHRVSGDLQAIVKKH